MDNSINFRGAILLKQPTKNNIEKKMLKVIGSHHQIFKNFTPEGDILYITRKGADKNVAELLSHHRTKYEFYTDLSTKSGFDDDLYEEARTILKNSKSTILRTRDELIDFFKLKKFQPIENATRKNNQINMSLKALGLNPEENIVNKKNGYYDVTDADGNLKARISGPGQYGISFAYLYKEPEAATESKDIYKSTKRYAIRGKDIIFQYTNESGRSQFLKNYSRAVKANKLNTRTYA